MNLVIKIGASDEFRMPSFGLAVLEDDLSEYIGTYVSEKGGISVQCFSENGKLELFFANQMFTLEKWDKNKFWNELHGLFFEFDKGQLVIKE